VQSPPCRRTSWARAGPPGRSWKSRKKSRSTSKGTEAAFGWEWLADVLEAEGIELHLAHPRHTKAIAAARVKTDAVDARTLAHLLRADLLLEA
jgi:transposase